MSQGFASILQNNTVLTVHALVHDLIMNGLVVSMKGHSYSLTLYRSTLSVSVLTTSTSVTFALPCVFLQVMPVVHASCEKQQGDQRFSTVFACNQSKFVSPELTDQENETARSWTTPDRSQNCTQTENQQGYECLVTAPAKAVHITGQEAGQLLIVLRTVHRRNTNKATSVW